MGGDRTLNDTLLAILRHVFPNPKDLFERPADRVVDQMLESGIQLGTARLGGANDIGANYGAPGNKTADIMSYLDDARLLCLNLGAAFTYGDPTPHFFCHSVSAGPTLAASFEETQDERGMAAKWHRVRIGMANILKHRPTHVRWRDGEGVTHRRPVLEILAHAAVRVAQYNGLPGTPQPGGLGVIVFPGESRWKTMKLFREVMARGFSSQKGNPQGLLPSDRLQTFTDPSLQIALAVGDERTFSFCDENNAPKEEPIGPNGDHLRRSSSLTVRACPPFPNFMGMKGSLMANLYDTLV